MTLPHAKGYPDAAAARRSKRYLTNADAIIVENCPFCPLMHVEVPKGRPQPRLKLRDTGPSRLVREAVLNRDGGCCLHCGASVIGRPYSIHHRKRRSQGGRNEASNLALTCGSGITGCHGHIHSHIAESLAAGWLVNSTADPLTVPLLGIAAAPETAVWLTDDAEIVLQPPEGAVA